MEPVRLYRTFLGLDPEESAYASARFVLLPIPYDATVSFQSGTRHGPAAIIAASEHLENLRRRARPDTCSAGIAVVPAVDAVADGPEAMHAAIHAAASALHADDKFVFGLGGEHGVSSGLIRAAADRFGKISILQIDAHLDLRDSYQGSRHSHATVMRRALEYAETLVPVGIRNVCAEERDFLAATDIVPVMAADCVRGDDWLWPAVDRLGEQVYVTIDIDGFDPAYAPGTGTPVPGGLDWYQVTRLLRAVASKRRIIAADIVEVMPIPGQAVTEFLAARLAYRLMGYVLASDEGVI
jgi:agmatinase